MVAQNSALSVALRPSKRASDRSQWVKGRLVEPNHVAQKNIGDMKSQTRVQRGQSLCERSEQAHLGVHTHQNRNPPPPPQKLNFWLEKVLQNKKKFKVALWVNPQGKRIETRIWR